MGAQEWIYGLVIYFVGISIVISLFSIAGVLNPNQFHSSGGYNPQQQGQANFSDLPTGVTSTFSMGKFFKDIFSFFVFNISIGSPGSIIYQYLWLIRIIFVYMPLTFLALAVWYSLPTVGG
jgi:hypothetical protein